MPEPIYCRWEPSGPTQAIFAFDESKIKRADDGKFGSGGGSSKKSSSSDARPQKQDTEAKGPPSDYEVRVDNLMQSSKPVQNALQQSNDAVPGDKRSNKRATKSLRGAMRSIEKIRKKNFIQMQRSAKKKDKDAIGEDVKQYMVSVAALYLIQQRIEKHQAEV